MISLWSHDEQWEVGGSGLPEEPVQDLAAPHHSRTAQEQPHQGHTYITTETLKKWFKYLLKLVIIRFLNFFNVYSYIYMFKFLLNMVWSDLKLVKEL